MFKLAELLEDLSLFIFFILQKLIPIILILIIIWIINKIKNYMQDEHKLLVELHSKVLKLEKEVEELKNTKTEEK